MSPAIGLEQQEDRDKSADTVVAAGTDANAFTTAPRDGLFDVFQIPEPPTPVAPRVRGPNSFPEESVNQYWEVLENVLSQPKAQRKNTMKPVSDEVAMPAFNWLRSEEPAVEIDLPTFSRALNDGIKTLPGGSDSDGHRAFAEELSRQRERFCQKMGFTDQQVQLAEGALYQVSNLCAKFAKGLPMDVIWHKVKESGIVSQNHLHNMLYVSGTFSAASLSARNKRQSKYGHLTGTTSILDALDPLPEEVKAGVAESRINFVDMVDEIAIYHDLLYKPTEQSINVRVKLLVAQGKASEAENLLDGNASGETALRLRGYLPVLRLYLELGDLSSAMRLYNKMRNMSTVHLDVEAYMHVITGIAERGVFAENADPIDGAVDLGYENASGPGLFDELCSEMASEIIEVPETAGKKLYNSLARGFPGSNLTETTSLAPLRITNVDAVSDDLFAGRVRVEPTTGVCPRTGVKLRLVHLTESQREKLVSSLMSLATSRQSRYEEKRAEPHGSIGVPAHENLMEFYQWLDQRDGEPFTTLVDGANVGYFQQNFDNGRFSYHQIKFVVDALESMGENVLVVLPAKYTKDWFRSTAGHRGTEKQRLTKEEKAIRNWLTKTKKIASIPQGYLGTFV